MRKIGLWFMVSAFLLIFTLSFAEAPRDGTSSEGKSTFTNIAVRGFNQDGTGIFHNTGNPGYFEMTSTKGDVFYLYIGYDGKLRIASGPAVGYEASPSTLGWGDASGPIVGLQNQNPGE